MNQNKSASEHSPYSVRSIANNQKRNLPLSVTISQSSPVKTIRLHTNTEEAATVTKSAK